MAKPRGVPINWPVLGMLPGLLGSLHRLHDWTVHLLRQTGLTFFFKGPPLLSKLDFVFTCDPANINHIFTSSFADYPKGPDFAEIFDVLGHGIFVADEDSWAAQRKAAHGLLVDARFRGFVAEMSKRKDVFLRFTFDTTCGIVIGVDPDCLSDGLPRVPFAHAIDDVEEAILLRHVIPKRWWKLMRWLNVGHEKKLASARETIDQDTTAAGLAWFFWLVSNNPHVETKIYEELKARFGEADEQTKVFDVESLRGLVYLHAALSEALRLYPPVPFEHKWAAKADVLPSGVSVGRGTEILFSTPKRWITERGTIKYEPSHKFLAFNARPRTCSGKDMVFTQMKIVAAAMIYNFEVEAVEGHVVEPKLSIILHMKNGSWLR
ncbi:Cytochrome P450 86B1 [Acorus calamus]|uniref:Cytochrome P450 86B1 n=1 Tax=Acorus calamus TaxID=4465 RepID=A0AAV9EDJ9_ACOCL|nr:Cytochrome P450 86B1 [Acorus calamus]